MHSLLALLLVVSFAEGKKWYDILDEHLQWPEEKQHCKELLQHFDTHKSLEAWECLLNHPNVARESTLKTGEVDCDALIKVFKPENWQKMADGKKTRVAHCIVDRVLTHELSTTFTSQEGQEGQPSVVWTRRKDL